MTRNMVIK